ncbi:MAG TPA: M48 family metallopeptidase [Dehalococcoidia bacterium]|nr:M48 family metallopeptidase [Dehalococcoidia bacterium]
MAEAPHERVLIYDRIGANKRSTFFLLLGFIVFTALFATAVATIVASYSGVNVANDPGTVIRVAVASVLIATGVGIVMYYISTAAVLAITGGHEVTKEEEPDLYRVVENLAIGSGLPMPRVFVVEDDAPNAFATGRNPQNAVVAATRGLLNKLDHNELEAVMAHEMSHVGNYDTRMMTTVAVVVGITAAAADLLLRFTWFGAGARSGNRDKGNDGLGAVLLVIAIIFVVISPIIAAIMRMALSRQREYLADSCGALLSRNPGALADALEKISQDPVPLHDANKATAALYIENPLREHDSFLNNLFDTHPPVQERIKVLRAMG